MIDQNEVPAFQVKLNEILKKAINILTDDEKAFLRARRSYLTPVEKETYKGILTIEKPKKKKLLRLKK